MNSGIKRNELDFLLLTHEHMDHVGNNGWLKGENRLRCVRATTRGRTALRTICSTPSRSCTLFPEGEHFDLHSEYLDWMGPTAGPIDEFIREGDVIDLGGGTVLEAIELPGHSMAELGFFEPQTRTLVIADPLLPPFNPVLYLYEDPQAMRETFDKIERLLRELKVKCVLLAHDQPKSADETLDLLADCRRRVDKVEESIITHIKATPGISFAELRDRCCDDQNMVREWRALVSIDASLKAFAASGMVEKREDGWHHVG